MIHKVTADTLQEAVDKLPGNVVGLLAVRENGVWTIRYEVES
jgi:hypothetical protein